MSAKRTACRSIARSGWSETSCGAGADSAAVSPPRWTTCSARSTPEQSAVVDPVEALARALLYEGYLLYPYRSDAVKNRHRFTFGGLYPPAWCTRQAGSDSHA